MQKPTLQTILISMLIIVALFTSIYFPYKWKQLSNDFLNQTNQYGELLKQINDLQKEVRDLENGNGEVDDLEDWKTYNNPETNFTFKYPNDWKVNSYAGSRRIDIATIEKDKYLSGVSAPPKGNAWINFIVSLPENYEEFEKKEDNYGSPDSDEFVMILSRKIITDNSRAIGVTTGYWKGDLLSAQYDQIFNQVFSSFEFIADETADWKTYHNEEYGFEVKYPEDWEATGDVLFFDNLFYASEYELSEGPGFEDKYNDYAFISIGRYSEGTPTAAGIVTKGIEIKDFVHKLYSKDYFVSVKETVIGSQEGWIFGYKPTWGRGESIIKKGQNDYFKAYLKQNSDIVVISMWSGPEYTDYKKLINTYNQILSTFKFIE